MASHRLPMIVAGTRPEVIKLAPILKEVEEFVFVWSGQHRDYEMGLAFLEELGIRKPDYFISAANTSHSRQTSDIMLGVEQIIRRVKPSLVAALGDTNTVLATAQNRETSTSTHNTPHTTQLTRDKKLSRDKTLSHPWLLLVRPPGFEPGTTGSGGQCPTRLDDGRLVCL